MSAVLHHLLRDAAERSPETVAIAMRGEVVTYAELEARSNQFANALLARGCTPGSRVGLLCEKSLATYVALYGILKAGCAYVPLDRRAPADRLSYVVRDCSVSAIVTSAATSKMLPALIERTAESLVCCITLGQDQESTGDPRIIGEAEILSFPDGVAPRIESVDTDLAYILYTSGSTGTPKGVMISHVNSLTFVRWATRYARVTADERVSGHAPLHFDLSIFDVFATANARATLYPVPEVASTFPDRLLEWIVENRINIWYSVPSILSMMAQRPKFAAYAFEDLRLVVFAGEVFPVKYLQKWLQQARHCEFMNWYGPTETNVITAYRVQESPEELTGPVSIGSACENTEVFRIDENGQRVEQPDQVGEVCARGSGVALGYWGDQRKTDGAFLRNHWRPWLRDVYYKTGDLATVDASGNFQYLGRKDHMVKSRGYRIELGEIEFALCRHERVNEAAVVPVPDEVIGNRLVACVVVDDGHADASGEILAAVSRTVPPYMVPERIQFWLELPKTSTGKVDRQALLAALTRGESVS